jgi:hypothetical protein
MKRVHEIESSAAAELEPTIKLANADGALARAIDEGTLLIQAASSAAGLWPASVAGIHSAFAALNAAKPSGTSCERGHFCLLHLLRRKNEQVSGKVC